MTNTKLIKYRYLYKVNNVKRNAYIFEWLEGGDNCDDRLRIWIPNTKMFKSYEKGYNNYVRV